MTFIAMAIMEKARAGVARVFTRAAAICLPRYTHDTTQAYTHDPLRPVYLPTRPLSHSLALSQHVSPNRLPTYRSSPPTYLPIITTYLPTDHHHLPTYRSSPPTCLPIITA
eukprot:1652811-Pleurochrysis_carterae.AAC.1